MKKLTTILISGLLIASAAACTDTARTSADAPAPDDTTATAPDTSTAEETDEDATDELRQRQLDSDIRAREERDQALGGDDIERADGDLASEVRSKLEANLPASLLTVEAEDGAVAITGTVPTQEQFDRIEPLAREIKGVQSVSVDVDVAPAQPEG